MRKRYLIVIVLLLMGIMAGCSSKGPQMPKHRKDKHCNCPTFSQGQVERYYDAG